MLPKIEIENGRIANEPQLAFTKSGKAYLKLRIAAHNNTLANGKWETIAECWLDVVIWSNRYLDAEALTNNLQKGDKVFIAGTLESRQYETNDGQKRTGYTVKATKLMKANGDDYVPVSQAPDVWAAPVTTVDLADVPF